MPETMEAQQERRRQTTAERRTARPVDPNIENRIGNPRISPARSRLPGKSTVGGGIPVTTSPATAGRRGGMAESSNGSWIRSKPLAASNPDGLGPGFAPTEWSQRSVVRIRVGHDQDSFPFFHATTSSEWVVTLRFFVPKNTFLPVCARGRLKLVPFHERKRRCSATSHG